MKKLIFSFLALTLSVGLWAEIQKVSYHYPEYNTPDDPTSGIKEWKTGTVGATVVRSASNRIAWAAGWYVVNSDVTLSEGVVCKGKVHLILADGAKLTAVGLYDYKTPAIQVSGDSDFFTIYAQSTDSTIMGQLIATGDGDGAGIGGKSGAFGSNITINGGVVTAIGSDWAAGIGGGYQGSGSDITINGGVVTAKGGPMAAGIGGGSGAQGQNITINGGTVTAEGSNWSAGIGGGKDGYGSHITINGGQVTAVGGLFSSAIGSGNMGPAASNIFVSTKCILKAGTDKNPTTEIATDRTDITDIAGDLAGKQYATIKTPVAIPYCAPVYVDDTDPSKGILNWKTISINKYKEVTNASDSVIWTTGLYVVNDDVQLSKGAICQGDVQLILLDDAQLTVTGDKTKNAPGIQVSGEGNSLTIYGQTEQSGQLIVTAADSAAGIGGGNWDCGSNITINGGNITSTGGFQGAGIGGGNGFTDSTPQGGNGFNIIINGGKVTAIGGGYAAGIGGGSDGFGSDIIINGGEVRANGGSHGAGIGSGDEGPAASNIFVTTSLVVKADNSEHPSTVIANTGADLANDLAGKRYVLIGTGSGFIPTSMLKTNSKDNAKKIMYNGQVIIRKGDKCYNLLGQEL